MTDEKPRVWVTESHGPERGKFGWECERCWVRRVGIRTREDAHAGALAHECRKETTP